MYHFSSYFAWHCIESLILLSLKKNWKKLKLNKWIENNKVLTYELCKVFIFEGIMHILLHNPVTKIIIKSLMTWAMKIFCKHNNSFYTCTRSHFKTHRIQKLPDLKYPCESSYKCDNKKDTSNTNNKWYSLK